MEFIGINEIRVELARIETKKESLENEMETHLVERKDNIIKSPPQTKIEPHTMESQKL